MAEVLRNFELSELRNFRRYLPLVLMVVFITTAGTHLAAQCAMCKQAAETSMKSDPNSLAKNLNSGILYLMAVPYLMIAFIFRKQLAVLAKKVFYRLRTR
jgi:hypothetical protein